jgi:hypothetical protein
MMERITMANTDMTMLLTWLTAVLFLLGLCPCSYHDHAFIADTTGFTMVGDYVLWQRSEVGGADRRASSAGGDDAAGCRIKPLLHGLQYLYS